MRSTRGYLEIWYSSEGILVSLIFVSKKASFMKTTILYKLWSYVCRVEESAGEVHKEDEPVDFGTLKRSTYFNAE